MKFDIKDIEFLSSKEHKKYLRFKKWTTSSYGGSEINLPASFWVTLGAILVLLSIKYWKDWASSHGFISNFVEYVFSLFFFGYYIGFFYYGIFLLFESIIIWILKKFVLDKRYTAQNNAFQCADIRIQESIIDYIRKLHPIVLTELSKATDIQKFDALKLDYIENYSFIKTAVRYLKFDTYKQDDIKRYLGRGREIIETITFHIPEDNIKNSSISSNPQGTDNFKGILKKANETFSNQASNPDNKPLIDIIKETLKDSEKEEQLRSYSKEVENQPKDDSSVPITTSKTLEQKLNEIVSKDNKKNYQTLKPKSGIINRISIRNSDVETRKQKKSDLQPHSKKPKSITINPARINWMEINNKRKSIGDAGELIVYNYEVEKLLKYDLIELIPKIEHSSVINGDACGYDIKSFNENGEVLFIEVKSTEGSLTNPIYFSKNEADKMKYLGESYHLYRVHNLDVINKTCSISIYPGYKNIISNFEFIPETIKARLK